MITGDSQLLRTMNLASPKRGAVLQRFATAAIPLLILWVTMGMVWRHHDVTDKRKALVRVEQERIDVLASRMVHDIDAMALHLLMFSSNVELQQMLSDDDREISNSSLKHEFMASMKLGRLITQGRVLDAHGLELLRINDDDLHEQPFVVPAKQLQSKGPRPYFRRAAALPAGKVDISPINQNVEQDAIEQPVHLTLRFSTPIRNNAGNLLGVLVFNYRVRNLLVLMAGSDLLLGAGPFWLRAPHGKTASGLVSGEIRRELSTRLEDVMDQVRRESSGWLSVNNGDGILVFTSLKKIADARHLLSLDATNHAYSWRNWRLVALLPKDELHYSMQVFFLLALAGFSMLLTLASWLWARASVLRELAVLQSGRLAYDNRRLAQRLLMFEEEERRLLAQELHDEMGQSLTAIKTNAILILRHCTKGEQTIAESAEEIRSISAHLFNVVRQRLRQLRPPLLDHAGLSICLKESLTSWAKRTGINCKLNVEGDIDSLSSDVNIAIYRIIQEALANISRHAQASSAYFNLRRHTSALPEELDMIELEIRDNGIGTREDKSSNGLGLIGMRERAWALGGSFSISSSPGNGMSITVRIPLQTEQEKNHE